MRKVDILWSQYEIINVKMSLNSPFMMFVISHMYGLERKNKCIHNMQDIIDKLIAIMLKDW